MLCLGYPYLCCVKNTSTNVFFVFLIFFIGLPTIERQNSIELILRDRLSVSVIQRFSYNGVVLILSFQENVTAIRRCSLFSMSAIGRFSCTNKAGRRIEDMLNDSLKRKTVR